MEKIKKDNKYENGKIYKITDLNEEMIYIGSTVESLCVRMAKHRYAYKHKSNIMSFKIFDKYGVENCKILLIEKFPCNSKEELCKKEGEYIKSTNCVNKIVAGRTHIEYWKDNKKELNKKQREYYEDNKEELNKKRLTKIKCPICDSITSKSNISQHQKTKKCISKKI